MSGGTLYSSCGFLGFNRTEAVQEQCEEKQCEEKQCEPTVKCENGIRVYEPVGSKNSKGKSFRSACQKGRITCPEMDDNYVCVTHQNEQDTASDIKKDMLAFWDK